MSAPRPDLPVGPASTLEPAGESIGVAARSEGAGGTSDLKKVSGWFITVFGITNFAFYLTVLMPGLFSLAYKIQVVDPDNKEFSLGLVVGVAALVNIVCGPIAGVLSDNTKFRWGRRRPFLVIGIGIGLVGALIIAVAPGVSLVMVGWMLANVGQAFCSAAITPIVAEQVPEIQRGKIAAVQGIATQIAGVAAALVGSLLTGNQLLLFLLPVAVLAVASVLWFTTIPDQPARADTPRSSLRSIVKDLSFNPRKHKDFALVWLGRFLFQSAMTLFATYQLYYLLDRMGLTPEGAGQQLALLGGIGILFTTGFAIFGGVLSDRLRQRKAFIYGAAVIVAFGVLNLAFAQNILFFAIGAVAVSAGAGLFGSVDVAMASDLLPEKDRAGKYMTLYNVAASLPSAIAPVFAPFILLIGGQGQNYTMLFAVAAVLALSVAVVSWRIRGVR